MALTSRLTQHHDTILGELTKGKSAADIARKLRVPRSTVRDYIDKFTTEERGRIQEIVAQLNTEDEPLVSREELLEQELKELQARARKIQKLDVQAERVLLDIREHIVAADVKYEPPELPAESASLGRHVQAALFSDLHGGEIVLPEAVDYLNEYSWEIMEWRIAKWRRSLLSYQAHRPYPIEELQLWWLGDMCSGSNHLEILETNEYNAAEQGVKMGMLLGKLVESLVPHFPRIVIYGVPGNHPRVPAAPQSKNVFNNFDWVAYKIAETYLTDYKSVECHFPNGGMIVAHIAGLNWLLFHGDGIRSSMPGVPWGGVMRRVNELKKQYASRPEPIIIHGFGLGHFHQACVVQNILMNGSVKGQDEYSIKNFGSGEAPTQLLATFDADKHRVTDVSYINP